MVDTRKRPDHASSRAISQFNTGSEKYSARILYFFQMIMTHCIRLFLPTDCFCSYLLKILKCNNALSESGNSKYVMNTGYMRVLKKGGWGICMDSRGCRGISNQDLTLLIDFWVRVFACLHVHVFHAPAWIHEIL